MKIGNLEKPSFVKIHQVFLSLIKEMTGFEADPEQSWTEIADSETRERIVKEFVRRMEQQYALEMVLNASLKDKEGSLEGVIGEIYHVFSTMFLVEAINSKIRAGQGGVDVT